MSYQQKWMRTAHYLNKLHNSDRATQPSSIGGPWATDNFRIFHTLHHTIGNNSTMIYSDGCLNISTTWHGAKSSSETVPLDSPYTFVVEWVFCIQVENVFHYLTWLGDAKLKYHNVCKHLATPSREVITFETSWHGMAMTNRQVRRYISTWRTILPREILKKVVSKTIIHWLTLLGDTKISSHNLCNHLVWLATLSCRVGRCHSTRRTTLLSAIFSAGRQQNISHHLTWLGDVKLSSPNLLQLHKPGDTSHAFTKRDF